MLRIRKTKWGNYVFDLWIILFTALVVWSIIQIQHSRVDSCKQTYDSFNKVFDPFFPLKPTAQQQKDQAKFEGIIRRLQAQCGSQVHLWSY